MAIGDPIPNAAYPTPGQGVTLGLDGKLPASILPSSSVTVQHNGAAGVSEPRLDFEDAGANIWTITNDTANSRVKITPPKMLTGLVNADSTIASGTGFSVASGGAGIFNVTFTVSFSAAPTVVACAQSSATVVANVSSIASSGFTVRTFNTTPTLGNTPFSFFAVAIG